MNGSTKAVVVVGVLKVRDANVSSLFLMMSLLYVRAELSVCLGGCFAFHILNSTTLQYIIGRAAKV